MERASIPAMLGTGATKSQQIWVRWKIRELTQAWIIINSLIKIGLYLLKVLLPMHIINIET